jgi:hypothetical protein
MLHLRGAALVSDLHAQTGSSLVSGKHPQKIQSLSGDFIFDFIWRALLANSSRFSGDLAARPLFAAVILITVAIGVGANTVI